MNAIWQQTVRLQSNWSNSLDQCRGHTGDLIQLFRTMKRSLSNWKPPLCAPNLRIRFYFVVNLFRLKSKTATFTWRHRNCIRKSVCRAKGIVLYSSWLLTVLRFESFRKKILKQKKTLQWACHTPNYSWGIFLINISMLHKAFQLNSINRTILWRNRSSYGVYN